MARKKEEYNPFFTGEDDDDYGFGNRGSRTNDDEDDDNLNLYHTQAKIDASLRNQQTSLDRSLAVMAETEEVANATAEVVFEWSLNG